MLRLGSAHPCSLYVIAQNRLQARLSQYTADIILPLKKSKDYALDKINVTESPSPTFLYTKEESDE